MSVNANNKAACKAALGRDCIPDVFVSSGAFVGHSENDVLPKMKGVATAFKPTQAKALGLSTKNFGVGDL
ncbi:hypothetical protein THRCLA_21030 [Thraustotheca clavata]|uniref:Uncharacterized protein n=1 Tax=Thraustotheca clavata TaxID=74557 RepID=A0A1W0A136_9STRA|nr:hypothetical protein THRCLA_21030 [Thraustotheca clavata]